MSHRIIIDNEVAGVLAPLDPRDIRDAVSFTLDAENVRLPCAVYVTITDSGGIRELNRLHRDTDETTDVLSFPFQSMEPGVFDAEPDASTGKVELGDIVLNAERVKAQAAEYGNTVSRETAYLTVHSVLHLLSYDHGDEDSKRRMRRREKEIIRSLGYDEPD